MLYLVEGERLATQLVDRLEEVGGGWLGFLLLDCGQLGLVAQVLHVLEVFMDWLGLP